MPETLWRAVDALTLPDRQRVHLDGDDEHPDGRTITATVPSLWDQLVEAAEPGAETGGATSRAPGSRPPTGDDVLAVRLAITAGVTHRRVLAGLRPVEDIAAGLRGLAAHHAGGGDPDAVTELADLAAGWVRAARAALRIGHTARGLRVRCPRPACGQTWVPGPDGRESALVVVLSPAGVVRAATCRACQAVWWRGDPLDRLGDYVRALGPACEAAVAHS